MAITIIPVGEQAKGQFNGGEILENKPIGFPRMEERESLIPYCFIGHMHGQSMEAPLESILIKALRLSLMC